MNSGTINIVRFNWPFYALAGGVVAVAFLFPMMPTLAAASVAAYFALASLVASYIVYDRSGITRWECLRDVIPANAKRIANVNAGFDDTSDAIRALFPDADVVTYVFRETGKPEPSIVRARRLQPTQAAGELDVPPRSLDAILLLLAAHEMRERSERERFFRLAAESLGGGGRIILVEHLRDLANALAYGPGVFHFYPASEWRSLAAVSGLTMAGELRLTPFVRGFVLARD